MQDIVIEDEGGYFDAGGFQVAFEVLERLRQETQKSAKWSADWNDFRFSRQSKRKLEANLFFSKHCVECGFPLSCGEHTPDCKLEFHPRHVYIKYGKEEGGIDRYACLQPVAEKLAPLFAQLMFACPVVYMPHIFRAESLQTDIPH